MDDPKICEHCGAKMVEYRHSMSKVLLIGLRALRDAGGGPMPLRHLTLSYSERANLPKAKYWDLITRNVDDDWFLTERGRLFLQGVIRIPKHVWTYRNEVVRFSNDVTLVGEIKGWHAFGFRELEVAA